MFVIAVVSFGCSPATSGEQPSPTTPVAAHSPSAQPSPSPIPRTGVAFSKAWPNLKPRSVDATAWVEISIVPDGSVALGEALTPNPPYSQLGPAIMDRSSGRITMIRRFTKPHAQVVWIAGDKTWLVWVEASLQPTFSDWVMYSFNRETAQIRTLAAAPTPYPNTPLVIPSISNGVVVWSAIAAPDGIERVYAVNADGSNLRTLLANAVGPQIVWPWVMYDTAPTSPTASGTLSRMNLESGVTEAITGPSNVSYYAYDGEALAWISGDTTGIFLQSPVTARPTQIFAGGNLEFVTLNQRLVGWGQNQGAFAFDRKLGLVVQLSDLGNYYPAFGADAFDWLYQPNANAANPFSGTVYEMANISALP